LSCVRPRNTDLPSRALAPMAPISLISAAHGYSSSVS
jgi:hypothetical protein